METSLTIHCGIVALTKRKQQLLNTEYDNLQHFLQTREDRSLHSANKQQALRYYKIIKRGKEYPISIRCDLLKIKYVGNKVSEYWAKIPVKGTRKLWVAIKPHRPFPDDYKICESKLYRRNGRFYLNVVIKCKVSLDLDFNFKKILAVDMGERTIASTVLLCNGKISNPSFYGKSIRGIRRHYSWLRRRLQEKKALKTLKKISDKERRKVKDILHKISKAIVDMAVKENAIIVIGDLQGIRQRVRDRGKGKRLNRIVHTMPYYSLKKMIEYKAIFRGVAVVSINEAYTSRICHRCGNEGERRTQGLFICKQCGEYNADLNGAINIGKKFERDIGYMPLSGAACEPALTPTIKLEKPSYL